MQRHRAIAGPPMRSTSQAWDTVRALLADTLAGDDPQARAAVGDALAPLDGLGPVLVGAGHLHNPMTLLGGALDVQITVVTGDAATTIEENLAPIPGGAGATEDWTLHLPKAGALDAAVRAVATSAAHLSCDPPPAATSAAGPRPAAVRDSATTTIASAGSAPRSTSPLIDPEALRRLRGQR